MVHMHGGKFKKFKNPELKKLKSLNLQYAYKILATYISGLINQ